MKDTSAPLKRTYVLVVNTHSRRGRGSFEKAKARLESDDTVTVLQAFAVRDPHKLDAILDKAVDLNPDVLLVGGGDGTVKNLVGRLVGRHIHCALLPLGTTNNFARSIGTPLELEAALEAAITGTAKAFDVGQVGTEDYFANVASLGLSTQIARRVPDKLKKFFGRRAYGLVGVRVLLGHQPMECVVEANGRTHRFSAHELVIANGSYHSAVEISQRADPADGELVAFSMDHGKRRQLLLNLLRFNRKGLSGMEATEVVRAQTIQLTTIPARHMELDGEYGPATPSTFTCLPQAVQFVVPKTAEN